MKYKYQIIFFTCLKFPVEAVTHLGIDRRLFHAASGLPPCFVADAHDYFRADAIFLSNPNKLYLELPMY